MCPATNKKCNLCAASFRGTMVPEEVLCAKCYVKTCEVPEDTDEQFLKLVEESHGKDFPTTPKNTSQLLPVINDLLNHKGRLRRLENIVEESRSKTTKEKNRAKREIYRLREEQKEMNILVESIKSKMYHFALMYNASSKPKPAPSSTPATSVTTKSAKTPSTVPNTVAMKRKTSTTKSKNNGKDNGKDKANGNDNGNENRSPPQSPPATPQSVLKSPTTSPVKLAAAKFEESARKVTSVVTFAKLPSKRPAPEVNNNDTPVTASSSSSEDENDENGSNGEKEFALKRSNSVRDRIKAFEEIQRRASTGSFDRRRGQDRKGVGRRSLTAIKSLNVGGA